MSKNSKARARTLEGQRQERRELIKLAVLVFSPLLGISSLVGLKWMEDWEAEKALALQAEGAEDRGHADFLLAQAYLERILAQGASLDQAAYSNLGDSPGDRALRAIAESNNSDETVVCDGRVCDFYKQDDLNRVIAEQNERKMAQDGLYVEIKALKEERNLLQKELDKLKANKPLPVYDCDFREQNTGTDGAEKALLNRIDRLNRKIEDKRTEAYALEDTRQIFWHLTELPVLTPKAEDMLSIGLGSSLSYMPDGYAEIRTVYEQYPAVMNAIHVEIVTAYMSNVFPEVTDPEQVKEVRNELKKLKREQNRLRQLERAYCQTQGGILNQSENPYSRQWLAVNDAYYKLLLSISVPVHVLDVKDLSVSVPFSFAQDSDTCYADFVPHIPTICDDPQASKPCFLQDYSYDDQYPYSRFSHLAMPLSPEDRLQESDPSATDPLNVQVEMMKFDDAHAPHPYY